MRIANGAPLRVEGVGPIPLGSVMRVGRVFYVPQSKYTLFGVWQLARKDWTLVIMPNGGHITARDGLHIPAIKSDV